MKKVAVGLLGGVIAITVIILIGVQMDQRVQVSDKKFNEEKSALIEEGYWEQAEKIRNDIIGMKEMEIATVTGKILRKSNILSVVGIARKLRDKGEYYPNLQIMVPHGSIIHGNIIAREIVCGNNVTIVGNLVAKDVILYEGCEVLGDVNAPMLTFAGPTDLALRSIKISGKRPERWYGDVRQSEMKMEIWRR